MTKKIREAGEELIALAGERADAEKGGPPKYNSNAYRQGWDTIFGRRQEVGQA
jgi:hypothetical protein